MADLSAVNSIINAYLQGRQLRQRQEEQAFSQTQRTEEAKEKIRQFDIQAKETERLHDAQINQQKATHALGLLNARREIVENIAKGIIPAPMKFPLTPEESYWNALDRETGRPFRESAPQKQSIEFGGQTFQPGEFVTPYELGQSELETKGPLLREEVQKILALEKTRQAGRIDIRKMIEEGLNIRLQEKQFGDSEREDQKAAHREQFAELRAKWSPAQNKELYLWRLKARNQSDLDKPLPSSMLALLPGLPVGTTWNQAVGYMPQAKMTTAANTALREATDLKAEVNEAIMLGKKTNWQAHTPLIGNVVSKLRSAFPEDVTAATKGLAPADAAKIKENAANLITYRSLLNKIRAFQAHDKYGAAFTKIEKEMLRSWGADLATDPKVGEDRLMILQKALNRVIEHIKTPSYEITGPARRVTPPSSNLVDTLVEKYK